MAKLFYISNDVKNVVKVINNEAGYEQCLCSVFCACVLRLTWRRTQNAMLGATENMEFNNIY